MQVFLKAAVALVAILTAAPAVASEKIVWWDFFGGGDGVIMRELITRFNEEHKGKIEIKPTTLEWGIPYYTKLQISTATGVGPDVATYHLSRLGSAVRAKTLSVIDPKELEAAGLNDAHYTQAAIAAATIDGNRYAVPFDVHGQVLYYNKGILKDIGALGDDDKPRGIDTLDGWHATLATAKDRGYNGVVARSGSGDIRNTYSLFGQQGGKLVSNGKFLQGDNFDKMLKAFDEVASWNINGWEPQYLEDDSVSATFAAGKSAFLLHGNWEITTMTAEQNKEAGFTFGMLNYPNWFGTPANWADSHSFVIPDNVGRHMSPEKRAAVIEVIKWMNRNSLEWAAKAGHVPAYLPVSTSEDYRKLKPQSDYTDMAANAFYMPKTPLTGAASKFDDDWQNMMAGALNGEGDPKVALEKFRDHMNSQ